MPMTHQGGSNYTATPSGYKPPRDRRVNAKTVACPSCKAEVDAGCVTQAGKPTGNHPTRRRMALRAERNASGE